MKRTVPLLITAIGGFVLIVAYFIPATESWGEVAAIWFDVLASVAFILGGGNLLRVHLQKASDRRPGWGYSVVTLLAFLLMLFVGLTKWGAPPAVNQEFYGETFAKLAPASLPDGLLATAEGRKPEREDDRWLSASVRVQFSDDPQAGTISFRGWMRPNQRNDLLSYKDDLEWRCAVERLFAASRATSLGGRANYYADHHALSFRGRMSGEDRDALLSMSEDPQWTAAVNSIYERSQRVTTVAIEDLPSTLRFPQDLVANVTFDDQAGRLEITGPMTAGQREALGRNWQMFPLARPLDGAGREAFLNELRGLGPITPEQESAFHKVLDGSWTASLLRTILQEAGRGQEEDKSNCEMLAELQAGATDIKLKRPAGPDVPLTESQVEIIGRLAAGEFENLNDFVDAMAAAGGFTPRQQDAFWTFVEKNPTVGERDREIAVRLLREGPLNSAQRDRLLDGMRSQVAWRKGVGELFVAAHEVKYPWSGEYRAQGTPFWWLYEYAFKPLTATMFAMLAFYVASAAFRAFRAKNIEATLLLGTAFIILLGRTFAGVWLTAWLPDSVSGLRIEKLTVQIMQVFNTAGSRAIMIGIALGIASTSLKVLLGVDRSYLGSAEE